MDWRKIRRDKLAKAGSDESLRQEGSERRLTDRLVELWERFRTYSLWEQAAMAGGVLLVAIGVPVVVVALMTGGGEPPPVVRRPPINIAQPTSPPPTALPTATVAVEPTAQPTAAEPSPTPSPADRTGCDEIRGTAYRSPSERDWFLANCQDSGPVPQPTQPGAPPPPAPTEPPPPPPGPSPAQVAIAAAVYWMTNDAPLVYTVDSGSCSAGQSGSDWVVSCSASIQGCPSAICESIVTVCVSPSGSVRPC